ncbi:Homocysteine S-methyltransferase [Phycisphaerae bacterium RAS1]|nr:Homocysteine S-methyltransferase [Phycisphaerae bacterium RAS1]
MPTIAERFAACRLLDGAMGTELERRGVACPPPLWSAAALTAAPDAVRQIHVAYLKAGADILTANTFRTNPRTLAACGRSEEGATLTRLAVELARQAARDAQRDVLIAASVAPAADCYRPDLAADDATLHREHSQMAAWVLAAGADLAWIETMNTAREAAIAAACCAAAGLSLSISFVLREDGGLLGGDAIEDALAGVEPFEPLCVGLNCGPPTGITRHLPRLRRATHRPIAVYGHINNLTPTPGWRLAQAMSPRAYAAVAQRWINEGAAIVGGCCGTTPEHISAMTQVAGEYGTLSL